MLNAVFGLNPTRDTSLVGAVSLFFEEKKVMTAKRKPDYLVKVGIQNQTNEVHYTEVGAAWVNPSSDSVSIALKFGVLEKTLWCFPNNTANEPQVATSLDRERRRPDFNVVVPVETAGDKRSYTKIGAAWIQDSGAVTLKMDIATSASSIVLFRPKEE